MVAGEGSASLPVSPGSAAILIVPLTNMIRRTENINALAKASADASVTSLRSLLALLRCGELTAHKSSGKPRDPCQKRAAVIAASASWSLSVPPVVGPVRNTSRNLPICTSSPFASTAQSTGSRLT